jgi:hypothetical protein
MSVAVHRGQECVAIQPPCDICTHPESVGKIAGLLKSMTFPPIQPDPGCSIAVEEYKHERIAESSRHRVSFHVQLGSQQEMRLPIVYPNCYAR